MALARALAIAALAQFTTAAHAEWLIAQSPHFRVPADMPEADIRARVALLEDYRNLLIQMTKGDVSEAAERPLDVFIVETMAPAFPFGRAPPGLAGLYTANPGGIAAYDDPSSLGQDALQHEYAHHYMRANRAAAYPAWYVEGFAEYFMTARFKPQEIEVGRFNEMRARWLAGNDWLPLETILKRDIYGRGAGPVMMFYAQSWLMTHCFLGAPGQADKLKAYLGAVAAGGDPVQAFATHVASDFKRFQSDLRAYVRGRDFVSITFRRPAAAPVPVQVRPAPPGASSLLLLINRLMLSGGEDTAEDRAAREAAVKRVIARAPGSPLAARARALLAVRNGDPAAASLLDPLLAASPDDADLLLWRAAATPVATPEGRLEARRFLARAFKANPDDWCVMRLYALLAGLREGPLTANDLDVIRRAHELAPQVAQVVIDHATALVQVGDFKTAAAVLAPVANNPHDAKLATLAGRLRDAALAGDRKAFLKWL